MFGAGCWASGMTPLVGSPKHIGECAAAAADTTSGDSLSTPDAKRIQGEVQEVGGEQHICVPFIEGLRQLHIYIYVVAIKQHGA